MLLRSSPETLSCLFCGGGNTRLIFISIFTFIPYSGWSINKNISLKQTPAESNIYSQQNQDNIRPQPGSNCTSMLAAIDIPSRWDVEQRLVSSKWFTHLKVEYNLVLYRFIDTLLKGSTYSIDSLVLWAQSTRINLFDMLSS